MRASGLALVFFLIGFAGSRQARRCREPGGALKGTFRLDQAAALRASRSVVGNARHCA
jgi:hypothetical protein